MENVEAVESVDQIKTRVVGIDIRIERTTIALVDIRGAIFVLSKVSQATSHLYNNKFRFCIHCIHLYVILLIYCTFA